MKPNRNTAQLVFGLIIITVGALLTLDNLGYLYAGDYLHYWPAALIVLGVARLFDPTAARFWSGFWIILGGLLLLDRLDYMEFRLHEWWPLVLIALGGAVLWSSFRRGSSRPGHVAVVDGSRGTDTDDAIDLTAVMGGIQRSNTSQNFQGGKITAIMGGCELDLRQADIKEEAVFEIFAFWGGVSMKVPTSWTVTMNGLPIMGGFTDQTVPAHGGPMKRLVIRGTAIMGGVGAELTSS